MSNPSQRGWGNPPAPKTVRVPCAGLALNLRPEVAPLFAELIARVEKIKGKGWMTSSGGSNYRPIRNYEAKYAVLLKSNPAAAMELLSNHSWALAADFRAGSNPQAKNGPTDMPGNIAEICRSISPHLSWGGSWSGSRRDPMHFEYLGTPADAARDVAALTAANIVEDLVAQLNDDEKNRLMRAIDNYNRTWDTQQTSKVDGKTKLWLAEAFMFQEANMSAVRGLLERLVKKAGA